MLRKLLLPAAAIALLSGCIAAPYGYRQGYGDYYYGAPTVVYRDRTPYYPGPYYGDPYGYRYPRGPVWSFGLGYGYPYYGSSYGGYRYGGYPYSYRGGYGTPYHGHPYRPRPPVIVRPPGPEGGHHDRGPRPRDRDDPPWRNLDGIGRTSPPPQPNPPQRIATPRPEAPAQPRTVREEGGRGVRIRRAGEERDSGREQTP